LETFFPADLFRNICEVSRRTSRTVEQQHFTTMAKLPLLNKSLYRLSPGWTASTKQSPWRQRAHLKQANCLSCNPAAASRNRWDVLNICNVHIDNRFMALYLGLPGWAGTRRNIHPL